MKATGIPATFLLPKEIDPNAEHRIAVSLLLDRRRVLWNQNRPWVTLDLHGVAAVAEQDRVVAGLTEVRLELLALGYEDQFCQR